MNSEAQEMHNKLLEEIISLANEEQAKHLQRFFKTGKGDYGEGDLFLGIKVPLSRSVAKKYYNSVSLNDIEHLLQNPHHEVRFVALLLMTFIYEAKSSSEELKNNLVNLYLKNTQYINNWDLVDVSCHKILGKFAYETKNIAPLLELAETNHLWSTRIAVISTYYLIKRKDFSLILELSEKFLHHEHDLMQKAVGWMLREMGKIDIEPLYSFLDKHHKTMPRTMLRYSIEKLSPEKRNYYMGRIS